MAWRRRKTFFETRTFWMGAAGALLLVMVIAFVAPRAKRRYDRWSANRHVQRAADYCAKGDYKHAVLDARSVLEIDPLNVEATRVMAQALEGVGAPEAMQWRRRFDQLKPGDVENTIAWARDALNAGEL